MDAPRNRRGQSLGRAAVLPEPSDLTLEEVAARLRLKPQTVRALCARGAIPGAYRVPGGRGWRVPALALERACASSVPGRPIIRPPPPADDPPVRPETLERLRARGLLT